MKKYDIKKWVYALVAAVVCFAVSFAVSYWVSSKSAEKEAARSTRTVVKTQSVREIVSELKKSLPMDFGTGIIWTDMSLEDDDVIYDYSYSDLYAEDVDQALIDEIVVTDKQQVIDSQVIGYASDPDVKEWIDCLIANRYNVVYRYSDCENEYIYSFTIFPSEWEEALELR